MVPVGNVWNFKFVCIHYFVLLLGLRCCALSTDFLWESCDTRICSSRQLLIQCDQSSTILINNVTSVMGLAFDHRGYMNLRRMCMGMTSCDPNRGFCRQHQNTVFNVSYVCIPDQYVDKDCSPYGKSLRSNKGFIASPSYPSEARDPTCKWNIVVPPGYYGHIFLHEVSIPSPGRSCEGLLFVSDATCGKAFPKHRICDDASVTTTISACGNIQVLMGATRDYSMRFWLSYYVVPVAELNYLNMYDVDITCNAHRKERLQYSDTYFNLVNKVNHEGDSKDNTTSGGGTAVAEGDGGGVSYVVYIVLAFGLLVILIVIAIVVIYIRRRRAANKKQSPGNEHNPSSDIQQRPLPERADSSKRRPILQQSYSRVADEITPGQAPLQHSSPTYAEIEDFSDTGNKSKAKVVTSANKRAVDNSKRQLPAKPHEEADSIYFEIDDSKPGRIKTNEIKRDTTTNQSAVSSKNKLNHVKKYPDYAYKKKESNASNIYEECGDVTKDDTEKPYIDMTQSHVPKIGQQYLQQISKKYAKDKANLSKKTHVKTGRHNEYEECEDVPKTSDTKRNVVPKWKKESVTSDSDSDDGVMIENDLYEPFESAKV